MKNLAATSLLLIAVVLTTVGTAVAQINSNRSPAGEPPFHVRNGEAKPVGHFDPKQMLRLAFGLQPPNLAQEEQFLQNVMTPGSPEYRQFLTPDQWNQRFAPSVADEQAVVDWARNQGFTITQRYPNRLIVDVEAPAATIEKALNVTLNSYSFKGYVYFGNDRAPTLPSNLANIVHSVGGLHNFPYNQPAKSHVPEPPGPVYVPGPVVGGGHSHHVDGDNSKLPPSLRRSNQSNPPISNITGGLYDPTDIYSSNAYDSVALQNFGLCCNPLHVAGGAPPESSIAIATYGNLHSSGSTLTDLVGFHNQYPYLASNVTNILIDGGPGTCTVGPNQPCGNDSETTMDTEWTTAMANSFGSYLDTAQIWVYSSSGSAEDMYNAMLSDGHARTFTTSWSNTEISGISGSDMDTRHNIFNNMVGTGWTLMTASGDRGATDDCTVTSVSYPASDPDVIGVGGTNLQLFSDGTFNSETAWAGGTNAGSCSKNNGGSGGGCSVHYSAPPYQTGSSQSCGAGSRAVPDIALDAVGGQNIYWNGSLSFGGGTSISSPMLAGFFAQSEAYLLYIGSLIGNTCSLTFNLPCTPIGNGNYYLYYFGLNPSYAPHYPFYDITSGCNSNDITQGAMPNLTSYCAGTGFDNVTGWGSANMFQLAWAINTFLAGDFAAPNVNFTGPLTDHYYRTPQTVSWTIVDVSGNHAPVPAGVAGYSSQWDADVGDSSSKATPGSGDSYYSGPQNPFGTSGSLAVNNTVEGCHTAHVRAWDNSGFSSDNTFGPVCYDDIPPAVNCAAPDGKWHATDVVLACSSSDTLSGLANPADANFNLTTSVSAGTETSSAFTNSRTVFDVAGNSTTEGPLGPNMVDKKPPSIAITQPAATNYTHSSTLTLNYSVTDGGSGVGSVAPTMDGSSTVAGMGLSSGTPIYLLTSLALGPHTFKINAADNVNNQSSALVTFTIIVTAQSMIDDVNQLYSSGAISNANVYSGFLQKLNDALAARNAGKCSTATNIYSAFINQVMGQIGKGITAAAANILIADAQYLIAHCP